MSSDTPVNTLSENANKLLRDLLASGFAAYDARKGLDQSFELKIAALSAAHSFDVKQQDDIIKLGIDCGLKFCPHCKKNVVLTSKCTEPTRTSIYHSNFVNELISL